MFCPTDTHTNLSLNIPYLAPEVYTVPFTISDSSSPPRSTFINLPGNCRHSQLISSSHYMKVMEQIINTNQSMCATLLFVCSSV